MTKQKVKSQLPNPLYHLKALAIDYMLLENAKRIELEQGIKILNVKGLPLNIKGGARIVCVDDLQIIQVIQNLIIATVGKEKTEVKLFETEMSFDFYITNYSHFRKVDDKLTINQNFLNHLTTLTLSTCRGLVFSKLSGTFLQGMILPIISQNPINLDNVFVMKSSPKQKEVKA